MKRNAVLMFVLMFMLIATSALVGCSNQEEVAAIYTPGTYEGEGAGHAGPIEVAVTVSETEIEGIEILAFNDSEFAEGPTEDMITKIVEANTSDIDVVAGATVTTTGVKEAATMALAQASIDGTAPVATVDEEEEEVVLEDRSTDLVIIGAGGAGLTAAIEASDHGVDVIVLEKMPMVGGNTKYATGGLNAAETVSQEALGIEDDVEIFFEDTMKGGGNINNESLVRVLAERSAQTVEWLINLGTDLSDVGRMGGASVNRAHRPTGGAAVGGHLTEILHEQALERGVEILLNSEVIKINGNADAVEGVIVKTDQGEYTIEAKAVIVASGGFGANNELVASFDPALKGYGTTNHPGATGDVVDFAKGLDVSYVDMKEIQTHPTVMPSNNYMITEAVRGNGAILVNRDAKRFVNELETRAVVSDAQLAQEGASSFLFFDQTVRESLAAIEGYYKKGFLFEGETIEELAEIIEVDAATLTETVATYNAYVAAGEDQDFARQDLPTTLENGPYYAVEVAPAVHHTMGGVEINIDGMVMNSSGEPIAGLFAAGEVTGGVHGNNRLGGNALADITIFGRVAAESATDYIGQ